MRAVDYIAWAEEYERDAEKIQAVIDRKRALKRKWITADQRQQLNSEISAFRSIQRELRSMAHLLRKRGKK